MISSTVYKKKINFREQRTTAGNTPETYSKYAMKCYNPQGNNETAIFP